MKKIFIVCLLLHLLAKSENRINDLLIEAKQAMAQQKYDNAIHLFKKIVQEDSSHDEALFLAGLSHCHLYKFEEALEYFETLLAHAPFNHSALYNKAWALKTMGQFEESFPYYEKAIRVNPNHYDSHFGFSQALLATGNFERGLPEYQWRLRNLSYWQKQFELCRGNIQGKKIAILAEHGLGDAFQFIRFARLFKERGAYIIMQTFKPLLTILSRCCPFIDQVVWRGDPLPDHDIQVPLMSLPYIFNVRAETISTAIPYIFPDQELIQLWQKKLSHDTAFKIGVCWQCGRRENIFEKIPFNVREIPLSLFSQLTEIPGLSVYSIQKLDDQCESPEHYPHIKTLASDLDELHGRFMDTAALIENLDLVITADTSIAHLAGALGIPVWVLLPSVAEWRWMQYRTDSPWYPTMRLFRQQLPGNWQTVITEVIFELQKLLNNKN